MKRPVPPEKPKPEQFGFTPQRIARFEDPVGPWLVIATIVLSLAITVYFAQWLTLLIFALPLFAAGFVGYWLSKFAGLVWRSSQPDSEAYERYEAAIRDYERASAEYQVQLENWNRTQEAWWCGLSGPRFERELGKLLAARGYRVKFTGASGDGGVDLILENANDTILVQCKAHKKPIGPGAVRDLFGTFHHRGGSEAWLVSAAGFTTGAKHFAADKPIRLITIRDLLRT